MKVEQLTFECDLCGEEKTVAGHVKVPLDWVVIVLEPQDRTFVDKHICGHCVNKIKAHKG